MTDNVPAVVVPQLPDHLKQYQTGEDKVDAESMAASSISIPRISLKAKAFRYIINGEEVKKSPGTASFVILGVDPGPSKFVKTFYKGAYSGESVPPTCSSQDGVRPDPWAEEVQSDLCATCPKNRFGSAVSASGKKTKACRDSKRLWIVEPEDIAGTVYALGVPVTSLKALSKLGKEFSDMSVPIATAVVKATMDEDESYPIMDFAIASWLSAEDAAISTERSKARNWEGGPRTENAPVAVGSVNPTAAIQAPAPQVPTAGAPAKTGDVDSAIKNW
jgi:hypothetical protein